MCVAFTHFRKDKVIEFASDMKHAVRIRERRFSWTQRSAIAVINLINRDRQAF
ncbi:hypothetical protein CAter282_1807 [Collimonas arenae]|uniref:Uncharacterized protein n=1 Tax=Collimonas arenae TaxID=279058 RepID=A0A127PPF8_9BURK|nr:hypothetical protein CAter10_1947 [Collimonas arenae]AMP09583.1 hypothetical protein CAter282_1807 [Collimonas arenae]